MKAYIGYHGTKNTTARRIKKTNFMVDPKPGWLGSGIYFFEEGESLAREWGNYKHPGCYSVLRGEIEIPEERIFDLSDPSRTHSKHYHNVRRELIPALKQQNFNVKAKNKQDFDGKILNIICTKENYDLVRAFTYTYTEYDRANDTFSRFPNGIELCVRRNGYIKDRQII